MTHTYSISGMTCGSCQVKVQNILSEVAGVNTVTIDLAGGKAEISMDKHVPTSSFQQALKDYPKYELDDFASNSFVEPQMPVEETGSWLKIYKPILWIFTYITGTTLLVEAYHGELMWMRWMNHFMAGFFLVFSFFKFLNLKGFVESYSTYDILAKKWAGWGYFYVICELVLGILFLLGWNPLVTNAATLIIMSVSIVGVLQAVLNKRRIKCACLGDIFNLPMSTITVIEDLLMIVMSSIMLVSHL